MDPYKLDLSRHFPGCPKAWQNFIRLLQGNELEDGVPQPVIQHALDEYSAYYTPSNYYYSPYITFESESDATAFTLKFG